MTLLPMGRAALTRFSRAVAQAMRDMRCPAFMGEESRAGSRYMATALSCGSRMNRQGCPLSLEGASTAEETRASRLMLWLDMGNPSKGHP